MKSTMYRGNKLCISKIVYIYIKYKYITDSGVSESWIRMSMLGSSPDHASD